MGRSFFWECTADPTHKSADWRASWMFHWGTKYCVRCSAPMKDVRTEEELKKLMARSIAYRKGAH